MEGSILAFVFAIIFIISHIIKSIREASEVVRQQQLKQQQAQQNKRPPGQKPVADDEIINITRSKAAKPPKPIRHTLGQSPLSKPFGKDPLPYESGSRDSSPPRRQALSKKLAPQGEGHRFEADPGTLDPSRIVSPTIDPTVRPDLYSMTGIYEQGVQFTGHSKPAIAINLNDCLTRPEGIVQAVILAEILNKPAWQSHG
ncbi:MAG: hypothetical protein FWG73_06380 [Planctomycetaceae bacterium]|nr:hypothetical protein [Planctomycetaceae bacterium]